MAKPIESEQSGKIKFEQIKQLYNAIPTANVGYLLNAIILVFFLWNKIDHNTLIFWISAVTITVLARYILYYTYRSAQHISPEKKQWEFHFLIATLISAITWGAASFYLFANDSLIHQVFLIFIIGGICTGALTTLTPYLLPLLTFVTILAAPLIGHLLSHSSTMDTQMALAMSIYLLVIFYTAIKMNKNVIKGIQLYIQNKEHEKTISDHKLQHRVIVDHAPFGIWLVDLDGRYKFVNKTFCDAVGIPERKFLESTHLPDLLGEEMAANCLSSDKGCLEQEESHLSHETLTLVDGKKHLMEITKVKLKDEEDKVYGIIGISSDITQRQHNEEKLRKLSQAIEQSGESIMITNTKGAIEYINPSFTKITGFSEDDILGENPRILKSDNQKNEFYDELWATITSGRVWKSSIIDKRKDGSQFPSFVTISPIKDSDGNITHYVGTQQDMTENERLEDKLRQAQKMEAIGILVGGIAHDFNNMLAAVTGQLHIVKEMVSDTPEIVDKLEYIEKLSFESSDMIKQLLMFSRKATVEMKPLSLNAFSKEISKISVAGIPENIDFYRRFSDHSLMVSADSTQLQQVLINLLNNARDALSNTVNPKISYIVKRHKPNKDFKNKYPAEAELPYAHIIVKDNGVGVNEADMEHLFEPFFTTKEVGSGTGLGLSMVYGTIQTHGGIIEVASKLGKGTTFHIYLPLVKSAESVNIEQSFTKLFSGQGELILLVDDNDDVRRVGKTVLLKLGYNVIEAGDGIQAVDQFKDNINDIKLVIMDVIMPKLGGVPASKRIKELSPDMKVLFTTGYDQKELQEHDTLDETLTVISKPYRINHFSEIVWMKLNDKPSKQSET